MSVAEDTTQIPTPIPDVVALVDAPAPAIVNDLQSTISFESFNYHLRNIQSLSAHPFQVLSFDLSWKCIQEHKTNYPSDSLHHGLQGSVTL